MIHYAWRKFMRWLGYRRVLYMPSRHGLRMSDFWCWEYLPHLPPKDYTEKDMGWGLHL